MEKGSGLYSDIGKKVRDLLYKDYGSKHKSTFTTNFKEVTITSSGVKKGELCLVCVAAQGLVFQLTRKIKYDFKLYSDLNVLGRASADELAPGLKGIFSLITRNQRSVKVELQHQYESAVVSTRMGVSAAAGLTTYPVLNASGVVGYNGFTLGTDFSFDTASGNLTKFNAGLSYSHSDHNVASVTVNDKVDTFNVLYYHIVSPLSNTAFGVNVSYSLSCNEVTFTAGAQHAPNPKTLVKARLNNSGRVSALIQYEWCPKALFTISGEVDVREIQKSRKIGLAVALKT